MAIQPESFYIGPDGRRRPVLFPIDATVGPEIPRRITQKAKFDHNGIVSSIAFYNSAKYVYTGGRGCIKVWDVQQPESRTYLWKLTLPTTSYIRAMKFTLDEKKLIVAGETSYISVWDIENRKPRVNAELKATANECFALAVSSNSKFFFCCYSDGNIAMWDVQYLTQVEQFQAHAGGATCIAATDDNTIWTGGLDNTVRVWDIRQGKQLQKHDFSSKIFALECSPKGDWIAVGMEDSFVEVLHAVSFERYQLSLHRGSVFGLKFAASGKWFISMGKDNLLNGWRAPYGASLFQRIESSSIVSCDICAEDKYIVTGSADTTATVYRVEY